MKPICRPSIATDHLQAFEKGTSKIFLALPALGSPLAWPHLRSFDLLHPPFASIIKQEMISILLMTALLSWQALYEVDVLRKVHKSTKFTTFKPRTVLDRQNTQTRIDTEPGYVAT